VTYYVVFAPRAEASLEQLVKVAGQRWQIEQGFELAKGECGLDHYEVRKWQAWYLHITLSLLAHAFLVAVRAKELKKNLLCPQISVRLFPYCADLILPLKTRIAP
jgi:SRSO17 transposase